MSEHEVRLRTIREKFASANAELIGALESLDDETATRSPSEAWSPAQIGCHVATTTEFLTGGMAGAIEQVKVARPADFREEFSISKLPEKIKTFPQLEPPSDASRELALANLRASESSFAHAVDTITPERCGSECVQLPIGTLSLYEVGEFVSGHIHRHLGQLRRTLESS